MLRLILGIIVGAIAGVAVVVGVEMIGHQIWPVATNVDFKDKAAMQALMASMPVAALACVVVAWVLGAYVASMVALLFADRRRIAGLIAAGLLLAATLYVLVDVPHPAWMAVAGIAGILAAAWLSDRLFARKNA